MLVIGHDILTVTCFYTDCDFTLNVEERWGITYQGLSLALKEARSLFINHQDPRVCLYLAAGHHSLPYAGPDSSLDLSGQWGVTRGRLILQGAGREETILEVDPRNTLLTGKRVERLTIRDLQFRKSQELTSQGTVAEVGQGFVNLLITPEFPGLDAIYDKTSSTGRYLRKFQNVDGKCEILEEKNQQVPWKDYQKVGEREWRVLLKQESKVVDYQVGQLVGVKSKCCGNRKSVFFFCRGEVHGHGPLHHTMMLKVSSSLLKLHTSNIDDTRVIMTVL